MAAEAKALLDELMGRSRNLDPSQQPPDLKWSDDDVCKYYLCGFCPHELFTNTRADLGPCTKIHDEALRKDYQGNSKFEKCGYEDDFMRFLNTLVNDVEKRIRRGHQRLALNNQQATLNDLPINANDEKITMLTERINELVVQAEELGCEGKVEEAQGVMKLVDQLKEERLELESKPVNEDGPLMKQMEVCEVCGAFLIVGDAPQRQDEHLMGKQHAGYAQVRAEIDRRKEKARDELEAREASENKIKQEREDREKERQREREERRQKERDAEKRRERDRDRRRRSRSRSRDRGKDRRRSRSRERRRRSSSRDRRSRRSSSGNKDRKRSSSRGKRSRRSSSRDRKHESKRSRDNNSRSRGGSRDRKGRSRDKESERNGAHKEDGIADRMSRKGSVEEDYKPSEDVHNDKGIDDDRDEEVNPLSCVVDKEDGEASNTSPPVHVKEQDDASLANSEGDTKMDE